MHGKPENVHRFLAAKMINILLHNKGENTMFLRIAFLASLACGFGVATAEPARAVGCISGGIAGGVAGHVVHHGVLGAVGGCVAGHEYHKHHQEQNRENYNQPNNQSDYNQSNYNHR